MTDPKLLLMPLSTSGHVPERITGALSVAKYFGAHLDVLHAQVSPTQFLPEDGVGVSTELLKTLEAVAETQATTASKELKALFEKLCTAAGVVESDTLNEGTASAMWREVNGLRSELVAERGKVADAIIIPQSKTGKPTATFEAAVMRSGKPVILMPRALTDFTVKKVLVAWNGSTEAARAVTHALPLLHRADEVILATSELAKTNKPSLGALQQYLDTHGIATTQRVFNSSKRATGEALLSLCEDESADLMICGGFTHRRVHEQIFGGVTQHLMAHAHLPIFMMH